MWPARATVGRQSSRCARHLGGFFMLSRRGFLIGTGGLLTMAFVSDVRAFIRRKEAPLLAAPPRTAHTLYWDWPDEVIMHPSRRKELEKIAYMLIGSGAIPLRREKRAARPNRAA